MRSKMNITVIGCGEVGYVYAQALFDAGYSLQLYTPRPNKKILSFSTERNIFLHTEISEWINCSDIVISCTPGSVLLDVTKEVIPFLKNGSIFADFSSASPDDKRDAALLSVSKKIMFVDVVIMGSIDLHKASTPLIFAGNETEKIVTLMKNIGATIRVLPDAKAGDAASLKLLRSVFMKGLSALTVQCTVAAQYYGVKELLYEILSDLDKTSLAEFLDMLLRNHVTHACRQRHEVAEATKQLKASGLPVTLLSAVEEIFAVTCELTKTHPIQNKNPTTKDALIWLFENVKLNPTILKNQIF